MFVKVFKSIKESELESTIQSWLNRNTGIKIQGVSQSQGDIPYITLTIFYKKYVTTQVVYFLEK